MKKKNLRLISFLMMMFIVISSLPITAFASGGPISTEDVADIGTQTNNIPISEINEPISEDIPDTQSISLGAGEKTLAELATMQLDTSTLPEVISLTTATEKGHVNRLKEQEGSLNTILYQNRDGGKTQYIFARPVKYVDETGAIRDKSSKITAYTQNGYSYAMTDNSVKAYFPAQISDGIKVESGEYNIVMSPISVAASADALLNNEENRVAYRDAFGADTLVIYKTLSSGVKEDIVLISYRGQSSFEFELDTDGLLPFTENGRWYLTDSDGNKVARFADIAVKDSGDKTTLGTLSITENTDGTYKMTVSVSESFLTAADTTYPVYIDPTVTIYETFDAVRGFYDVPIYNEFYNAMYAAEDASTIYLGDMSGNGGNGKMIYELPDFYEESYGYYVNFEEGQIGTLTLHLHVSSDSSATLLINPMTSTYSGSIEEPSYILDEEEELINSYSTANSTSKSINSGSSDITIDITHLAKAWARYNSGDSTNAYDNPENGFIISVSNINNPVGIRNTEYSSDSNDVYFTLDYSDHGGETFFYSDTDDNSFLYARGYTPAISGFSNTTNRKWNVEYISSNLYYITSTAYPDYYLYYNGTNLTLSQIDPANTHMYFWQRIDGNGLLWKHPYSGFYLKCEDNSISMGTLPGVSDSEYKKFCWENLKSKDFVALNNFSIDTNLLLYNETKKINLQLTPQNASWVEDRHFVWSIESTYLEQDDTDPSKFKNLSDTATTAVITVKHIRSNTTRNFTIQLRPLKDGTYYFKNSGLNGFMQVNNNANASADTHLEIHNFNGEATQRWIVEHLDSVYYKITCEESNKAITAPNSKDNSLTQTNYDSSDTQKWIISANDAGQYKLSPCSSSSCFMSAGDGVTVNGRNVEMRDNQSDGKDEWYLYHTILKCWNSDTDKIYYWENNPTIYWEERLTCEGSFFESANNTALQQWNTSLGINITKTSEYMADIKCYGDTDENIRTAVRKELSLHFAGYTDLETVQVTTTYYGDSLKSVEKIISATVYIVIPQVRYFEGPMSTEDEQKHVATHEYGHALGYYGHSLNQNDVMYDLVHDRYNLTTADIAHIKQIYDWRDSEQ